jgi:DNA-binding CsgD family transcriptional regulator
MTGSAITPKTRPRRSQSEKPPFPDRTAERFARIVVGSRIFCVVPAPTINGRGLVMMTTGEQARFDLCGRTFMIVEENAPDPEDGDDTDVAARLTGRELQIAILVALDNPVKRIAFKLGIREWTVKEYLRRIFAKLRVRSQAAMVYRCADLLRSLDREGRLVDLVSETTSDQINPRRHNVDWRRENASEVGSGYSSS